jgi:carboxymethylenebutenolidase
VLQGTADEEVSPIRCRRLVEKSRSRNGDIEIVLYRGATHDFDDPGRRRQSVPANAAARDDATEFSIEFVAKLVKARPR